MTAASAKMQFICYYAFFATIFPKFMVANGSNKISEHRHSFIMEDESNAQPQSNPAQFTIDQILLSADNSQHDVSHLVFQPSLLDFEELPVGDADSDVVTIFNKHTNRSVYLGSISGNVPDFYSSFFEEKVIPPLGNTTFNVVFLPRQQGAIQTNLIIHTSFGVLNYTLKGKGVECLFRLNPLIGLRAPFNATLTPEIYMYNPYSTPLQIVEVYSSGGQFQLELPSGGPEGPQALWEIPPFSSKPVIRVRFKANSPGNHTAYIRIKVSAESNSELEDVVLVVPIEVEIFSGQGIYSEVPFINFGLAGTNDKPKKMIFKLLHSGQEPVNIESYYVEGDYDVTSAISVRVDTEAIASNLPIYLVTTIVDWAKLKTERYFKGHITIKTILRNNEVAIHRIPFVGEVLTGSIYYNESFTRFVTTSKATKATNDFTLKNHFQIALAVTNITFSDDAEKYFKITGFVPKVLQAGEEQPLFKITLLTTASKKPIVKSFMLHTNASVYEIPVITYNGLLRRIVPVDENTINGIGIDEKIINYGTLPLSKVTDTVLAFVNDNPVPVTLHNWTATISDAASIFVILRGCGNLTMDNLKFCYSIPPREWIVFQVSVLSNAVGTFVGKLSVKTDFEELVTPVRFSTAMGRLHFSATMLEESRCFPGGLCSVNLTAFSTFVQSMTVKEILVNVTGITYDYSNSDFPAIASNELTHIGQLQFNPKSICGEECYIALPDRWAPSVISSNCKNKEKDLMYAKLETFRGMKASFSSISFRVQTNQVRRYDFNGSAELIWPKLVEKDSIKFDTLQVGEVVTAYVNVHNPIDQPITVYYQMHDVGQNGASMTYPPEIISLCWDCFLSRETVFSLIDIDQGKRPSFDLLPPRSSTMIAIRFLAQNPGTFANLLYIRNNFTVLEAIWLQATAAPHQFKFGNRKPGSITPLMFELSDKHFRDCERKDGKEWDNLPLVVSAKRTFTAKNTGDVPIDIYGMYIEGVRCEGYGFRILDCSNFRLPPNSSKKVEIIFMPDFTLARVSRVLSIDTSLNYAINYTLLSLIPAHALNICSKAIRRPEWEDPALYITFLSLLIALTLVLLGAFLHSEKLLNDHLNNMSIDRGFMEPTLDLRDVGRHSNIVDDKSFGISENGVTTNKKKMPRKADPELHLTDKKSWASVLARKVSPIKSDVKFREETPSPLHHYRFDSKKEPSNKKHLTKELVEKMNASAKLIEDDSSSTTTENSIHSNDVSTSREAKHTSPTTRKSIISPLVTTDQSKLKHKLKKTKSLPNSANGKDSASSVIKSTKHPVIVSQTAIPTMQAIVPPPAVRIFNGRSRVRQISPDNIKRHVIQISMASPSNSYASTSQSISTSNKDSTSDKVLPPQKKYGKTPGRERKKHDTSSQSTGNSARKATSPKMVNSAHQKTSAFQFAAPLSDAVLANTAPAWDMKKISFSNIVSQNPYSPDPALGPAVTSYPSNEKISNIPKQLSTNTRQSSTKNKFGKAANKSLLFNYGQDDIVVEAEKPLDDCFKVLDNTSEDIITDDIQQSNNLGPIGTRKSPSNTPVWEALPSIQKPIATVNNNPNSYFSAEFPSYSNNLNGSNDINSQSTTNIDLGGVSGLFDNVYGRDLPQKQRVWDQSTLLNLLQQQQQGPQQQSAPERSITPPIHLAPLLQQPLQTIDQPDDNLSALYSNPNTLWGSPNYSPSWVQGPIRPPPGLEPIREHHVPTNRRHNEDANQFNGTDIDPGTPQFDLFRSLSSIWHSDTWGNNGDTNDDGTKRPSNTNAK